MNHCPFGLNSPPFGLCLQKSPLPFRLSLSKPILTVRAEPVEAHPDRSG